MNLKVHTSETTITAAETKVLELLQQGLTNREIANALCRSAATVKTHIERILAKTGSKNRTEVCVKMSGLNARNSI